ncbi:MAG: phosphatidylserine/phosphatidylglycerophosphate/cardiolipin synthase family protein [Bacteroidales bacterium]|nr:phosphatidylserine/phosphatidylglycerophosphate/cardiolipin synthase family protein [Bacteroidales bacterium]
MTQSSNFKLFDDPLKYYNSMLNDIENAKKYIYLETYRFNNDSIGIKFRDVITKKSKEGIEVKLLLDSWGTSLPSNFFADLIKNKGEVRYFKKIKLFWDFFTKNHRRNHRKILIVDDYISYIGSTNLTDYSINWRESVLRIDSDISLSLKKIFLRDYKIYNKYVFDRVGYSRKIKHNNCEIVQDVPSLTRQRIRKKYIRLIKCANTQIVIETPYFLPGFFMRKALSDAAKRGVNVKVIIPKHSDIGLIDILRNRYLGQLYKHNINFLFYTPHNLHAKILLIDKDVFSISSSNFDYRSFRYQHEIALVGENKSIIKQLDKHILGTIQNSERFDYEKWKQRPLIQKFFERILLPFRHLL